MSLPFLRSKNKQSKEIGFETQGIGQIIITTMRIMTYSGISRHVELVRADVSEESIASIIGVKIISKLGTTLALFLRNFGSYKSHSASLPRR
jgi:hypothetical protein